MSAILSNRTKPQYIATSAILGKAAVRVSQIQLLQSLLAALQLISSIISKKPFASRLGNDLKCPLSSREQLLLSLK
jgi:hypothetical protein